MNRTILAGLAGLLLVSGCANYDKQVASESTQALLLKRQQIEYRLYQTQGEWSVGRWGHDVIGDRDDLLQEKEAIERELMRRRSTVAATYPHLTGIPAGDWRQNAERN